MLRIEEPSSDFVRLLVRTVVLPEPHSTASSRSSSPPPANSIDGASSASPVPFSTDYDGPNLADSSTEAASEATENREALQDASVSHADSTSTSSTGNMQDAQAEVVADEQHQAVAGVPALSPDAVASLLSPASGCEVLLQEESRWLVVSETFSPGDICR